MDSMDLVHVSSMIKTVVYPLSQMHQGRLRLDIRTHFFTGREVKHWHKLPSEVVGAPGFSVLKGLLDSALINALTFS